MVWMMEHCVEPYFSFTEAATILGIDKRVLIKWHKLGKLKVKVIEGKNFVRLVDMEKIVFEGTPNKEMYMQVKKMEQAKLKRAVDKREARRRLQRQLYGKSRPQRTNKKN